MPEGEPVDPRLSDDELLAAIREKDRQLRIITGRDDAGGSLITHALMGIYSGDVIPRQALEFIHDAFSETLDHLTAPMQNT